MPFIDFRRQTINNLKKFFTNFIEAFEKFDTYKKICFIKEKKSS